jgi:hypothetical protein
MAFAEANLLNTIMPRKPVSGRLTKIGVETLRMMKKSCRKPDLHWSRTSRSIPTLVSVSIWGSRTAA